MEKEILINSAIRKKVFKKFGCTYPTIASALKYKTNSLMAHRIREFALKSGGALISPEVNEIDK